MSGLLRPAVRSQRADRGHDAAHAAGVRALDHADIARVNQPADRDGQPGAVGEPLPAPLRRHASCRARIRGPAQCTRSIPAISGASARAACSASSSGPSSSMSPRKAIRRPLATRPMPSSTGAACQHRQRRADRSRAGIVALVEQRRCCRRGPAGPSATVSRAPRPGPGRQAPSPRIARAGSAPAATAPASAATAFSARCRPGAPRRISAGSPRIERRIAVASAPGIASTRRISAGPSPKLSRGPDPAAAASRSCHSLSRGSTAVPPGSRPAKISALASAIPARLSKFSRCTGAIVVISATCGRARRASGAISPAWFMPISITAKSRIARHPRQRQRHTPMVVEAARGGMRPAPRRAASPPASP